MRYFTEKQRVIVDEESNATRGQNPVVQKAIAIQDMLAQQDTAVNWDSTAEIRKLRERNRF